MRWPKKVYVVYGQRLMDLQKTFLNPPQRISEETPVVIAEGTPAGIPKRSSKGKIYIMKLLEASLDHSG